MASLRQRLLLVAGWAVAAVATGLVSAGAVAVAGGQVTDRPLRPLSAAEVAALPVTNEDACSADGPLASGGPVPSSCPDRAGRNGLLPLGDATARPAEKGSTVDALVLGLGDIDRYDVPLDPAGPDVPLASDPVATSSDGVIVPKPAGDDALVPPLQPGPWQPTVVELVGGRVSVTRVGNALTLNWATPRQGFIADLSFKRPDELTVTFWDGSHLSAVTARISDRGLDVAPTEVRRNDGGGRRDQP